MAVVTVSYNNHLPSTYPDYNSIKLFYLPSSYAVFNSIC